MEEVRITAMSFGRYAVGRLDGEAVMVPHAAPGDVIDVEIEARRRGYAIGRIRRIVQPSPQRRAAPCPYVPRCGGCDWQHLSYAAQVRHKAEIVASTLARSLGIDVSPDGLVEPSHDELGYRGRIRLQVGRDGALGYHEPASRRLVAVERCLIAAPELRIPHQLGRELAGRAEEIEVVADGAGAQVLVVRLRGAPSARDRAAADRARAADTSVKGAVLCGRGARAVVGETAVRVAVEPGVELEIDADLFTQVNRAQNLGLVAAVMQMAGAAPGLTLLDLFCGAGNFSIPAARRGARVMGVDADEQAIAAAARNAARLSLGDVQFVAMKAAEFASFLMRARYRPQTIVLDPPRTGARELMQPIARLGPRTVVYVSCDVVTLARDLRELARAGYRLERVRGFDFFPNTHHVEVAARAVLT
jgi:23S rRNA (uracil1939-C5)-methyltransferase